MEIRSVSGSKRVLSNKAARRDLMNIKVRLINTAFSTGNAFLPNYKSNAFMNQLREVYKREESRKQQRSKQISEDENWGSPSSQLDFSKSYEPIEINYQPLPLQDFDEFGPEKEDQLDPEMQQQILDKMRKLNVLDLSSYVQTHTPVHPKKQVKRNRPGSSYVQRTVVMSRQNRRAVLQKSQEFSTLERYKAYERDTDQLSATLQEGQLVGTHAPINCMYTESPVISPQATDKIFTFRDQDEAEATSEPAPDQPEQTDEPQDARESSPHFKTKGRNLPQSSYSATQLPNRGQGIKLRQQKTPGLNLSTDEVTFRARQASPAHAQPAAQPYNTLHQTLLMATTSKSFVGDSIFQRKSDYVAQTKIPIHYPNGQFNFNPKRVLQSRAKLRTGDVNNRSWMVANDMIEKNRMNSTITRPRQQTHQVKIRQSSSEAALPRSDTAHANRKTILSKSNAKNYLMKKHGLVNLNETFSPPSSSQQSGVTAYGLLPNFGSSPKASEIGSAGTGRMSNSFSKALSENKLIKLRK